MRDLREKALKELLGKHLAQINLTRRRIQITLDQWGQLVFLELSHLCPAFTAPPRSEAEGQGKPGRDDQRQGDREDQRGWGRPEDGGTEVGGAPWLWAMHKECPGYSSHQC